MYKVKRSVMKAAYAVIFSYAKEYEIKLETLEIYLFGEWRLVSELETKYKLVVV